MAGAIQTQQKQAPLAQLNKPAASVAELRQLLTSPSVIEQIKQTLPKHMSAERLAKVMLSACLKTPKLMKVNQLSLLQVLTQLSELGLEPGSAMGHVYLLPFENRKENRTDVNVIIGYRGYIELARRSGWVKQIETHIVFEGEKFDLAYGLEDTRKLEHIPDWKIERTPEKAIAVYAIVRLKDGASHVEVMSMNEVRQIRNRSQAWKYKPNEGPWHDDFLEMARKTVIRRAQKYLPLSAEERDAVELDDAGDVVDSQVSRPDLQALSSGSVDDIASQMVSAAAQGESEEPEHNPETGEVVEHAPQTQAVVQEPEKGTIDHLLWRIAKSEAQDMEALKKEAFALHKDEPRRLEVSTAIKERTKALAMKVQP